MNNNAGIVNFPNFPAGGAGAPAPRVREQFAPVPNTVAAAEAMEAAAAAIAARAFDTSRLPIYVPTGHGELVVRDGDFVRHRVPDGCVYITFGYAGVPTWNTMFEKFLESFKDPEVMECFQNPTILENQIKLKKFFEPHLLDETAKFTIKEDGILSIKFPREEYIEARYFLTSDFPRSEKITESGFYNAKTIVKKDIKVFTELPDNVATDMKHILECYNGSIIPGPRFIYDKLGKKFLHKMPNKPTLSLRDTTMGWPIMEQYDEFLTEEEKKAELKQLIKDLEKGKQPVSKTIVDIFIRLLRAIREEMRVLPEDIYALPPKTQTKLLKPIYELVTKGLNIIEKGKKEAERAGVKHYSFIYSTFNLFKHLRYTRYDAPAVSKMVVDIQRYIDAIIRRRERSEEQFPGEGLLQSFLFKNFPGIHINFLCRVPSDKMAITPATIAEAQRLSDKDRAAKMNLKLAQELVEPTLFIGAAKEERRMAAAEERKQEMARLVELNRQAKLMSDPMAMRELVIATPNENVSEEELEEMRQFARRNIKQLSNRAISPRSTGKLSLPRSLGNLRTPSSRNTRRRSSGSSRPRSAAGATRATGATRRQRNRY